LTKSLQNTESDWDL